MTSKFERWLAAVNTQRATARPPLSVGRGQAFIQEGGILLTRVGGNGSQEWRLSEIPELIAWLRENFEDEVPA